MVATGSIFIFAGVVLFAAGLRGALLHTVLLSRVLAINVSGAGIFTVMIALAYRGPDQIPDALLHALVLTGIVVAVSASAVALALARRLREDEDGNK